MSVEKSVSMVQKAKQIIAEYDQEKKDLVLHGMLGFISVSPQLYSTFKSLVKRGSVREENQSSADAFIEFVEAVLRESDQRSDKNAQTT